MIRQLPEKFKKWCDEYFSLATATPRGVGGIFFDYVTAATDADFIYAGRRPSPS